MPTLSTASHLPWTFTELMPNAGIPMQAVKLREFVDQASRLLLKIADKEDKGLDSDDIESELLPKVTWLPSAPEGEMLCNFS